MGLLRRIAGFLGFGKDEAHEEEDDGNNENPIPSNHRFFSNTVAQVAADRAPVVPVLVPCNFRNGGVQGLRWYARSLKIDEDGDVADEFLHEVLPDTQLHVEENQRPLAKLEVKYSTRPVKVESQSLSVDGKIQQCVEYQGRLQWV